MERLIISVALAMVLAACENETVAPPPDPPPPDPCADLAGRTGFARVAAIQDLTMALRADGTVICWGGEYVGGFCLDSEGPAERHLLPVQSRGLVCITDLTLASTIGVALTAKGEGLIWASNPGILEPTEPWPEAGEALINRVIGLGRLRAIATGGEGVAVVDENGVAYWWGLLWRRQSTPERLEIPGSVASLDVAGGHLCAVTEAGEVWCVGDNRSGELGDGTQVERDKPVMVHGLPPSKEVSVAGSYSSALSTTGEVFYWGRDDGRFGRGLSPQSEPPIELSPVPTAALPPIATIEVGATGAGTLAVTTEGDLYGWGLNDGIIEAPDIYHIPYPTLISGPGRVVDAARGNHACAVRTDGAVWCGGYPLNLGREPTSGEDVAWGPITLP